MLNQHLAQRRDAILRSWQSVLLHSYPEEAVRVFSRKEDHFGNPVGAALHRCTETLLDGILAGEAASALRLPLEEIVKIRAIQTFTPSQALGFVPELKAVVRGQLEGLMTDLAMREELDQFEQRIDRLTLEAFDLYMASRERVFEIRVKEIRNQTAFLFERMNRGPAKPGAD